MAKSLKLMDYMKDLEATPPPEFVSPQIRYGFREDSLSFYSRNDESYAHRVNELITLFLSFDKNELVGCQVKGLRRRLLSDGAFGIAIKKGGKLKLGLFFHLLAFEIPEFEFRNRLVELGQLAKGLEVDTGQLALAGCSD
jgi:hypothetical protein